MRWQFPLLMLLCLLCCQAAHAAGTHKILRLPKYSAILIDASTGKVIYSKDPDSYRRPASLTKMMTLYLTFNALQSGKLRLNQKLTASHRASKQIPTKLGVRPGEKLSVLDCIYATIIHSANDAAVVLAEAIAGSEDRFAELMTQKARQLGMTKTNFANSHGCHDKRQYTTASDIVKLAKALKKDFPQYYHLFRKTSFTYKGRVFNGRNHVVKAYKGAEGLKTGYIKASGYNLVTSAKRNEGNLIGAVFGAETAKQRDQHMMDILDFGFCHLTNNFTYPKCGHLASFVNAVKSSSSSKGEGDIFKFADSKPSSARKRPARA